jgi:hypothetical protein
MLSVLPVVEVSQLDAPRICHQLIDTKRIPIRRHEKSEYPSMLPHCGQKDRQYERVVVANLESIDDSHIATAQLHIVAEACLGE